MALGTVADAAGAAPDELVAAASSEASVLSMGVAADEDAAAAADVAASRSAAYCWACTWFGGGMFWF